MVKNIFFFLFLVEKVKSLLFSSSREVLLHVHMKHLLLVRAGLVHLVAIIAMLEHQEIAVLPMVICLF